MLARVTSSFHKDRFLWITLLVAGALYGLISFVNHYCFRTYTLDLGAYTNALYDYAHFGFNDSTSFKSVPENLLADHFDLYLPLISPLVYFFGTYTLLVVQWLAVLFGAVGVYRYFEYVYPERKDKRFALIYFLLFFGIIAAFSFDYHSNVVATMFIPWLFLAFKKARMKGIVIWTILILIAKENMSLWMVFIGFGLTHLYWKQKHLRWAALGISLFSMLYFMVITGYVMPAFSNNGMYPHFHYAALGKNGGEALVELLTHPIDSFRLLFVNHSVFPENDFVKAELWIVLAACGIFCLRKPVYLFMLIPILAQKLYHDNVAMWGINQHYAIEFAPILAIGTFEALNHFPRRRMFQFVAVILSLVCGIRVMDNTVAYAEKARIRVYKEAHYSREFSIPDAYRVLKMIPDKAVVSAQSAFLPHLVLRPNAYQFPVIRNATYILVSPVENTYPISQPDFDKKVDSLKQATNWRVVFSNNEFLLLKRTEQ